VRLRHGLLVIFQGVVGVAHLIIAVSYFGVERRDGGSRGECARLGQVEGGIQVLDGLLWISLHLDDKGFLVVEGEALVEAVGHVEFFVFLEVVLRFLGLVQLAITTHEVIERVAQGDGVVGVDGALVSALEVVYRPLVVLENGVAATHIVYTFIK